MYDKSLYNLQKINSSHPELPAILALSVGNPTQEKLNKVLQEYDEKKYQIFGYFVKEKLIAMIGISINEKEATIEHVGVISEYRRAGIAKQLIKYVAKNFSFESIKAQTDDEAIAFYHALGFKSISFINKYGSTRFNCTLKID